jgi:hypothetical protein
MGTDILFDFLSTDFPVTGLAKASILGLKPFGIIRKTDILSIIVTCCILKLSVTVPAINLWIVT